MKKLLTILLSCTIIEALQTARPKAQWSITNGDYNTLVWLDKTQTKPSQDELTKAMATCQSNASTMTQALTDEKNSNLDPGVRLDNLIKALGL